MSTIIKVLKKLENSSTSKSRQPDSQNIKDVIKNRNKKYKTNYIINYIVLAVMIAILIVFCIKFFLERNTNSITKKSLIQKNSIIINKTIKIDHFANKVNQRKSNSDIFVNQIEKRTPLYRAIKKKPIPVRIKKKVNWNVNFQLTGILRYGKNNKRKACINNKWYEEGKIVNGILIKKININSITIKKDNQERIVNLN